MQPDQSSRSGSPGTEVPPLNTTSSSTMSSLDGVASFLAEVDAWLVGINKGINELEHRHEKNMSVTGEWWKTGGQLVDSQVSEEKVDDETRNTRGAA